MSRTEFLLLASHVLIVIGSLILYRTGSHITRVWSEMRAELWLLRNLMKNHCVTGELDTRAGPTSIDLTKEGRQTPSTERPPCPARS